MLTVGVGREWTDMCVDGECGREWTDMCVDGGCRAGVDGHVC